MQTSYPSRSIANWKLGVKAKLKDHLAKLENYYDYFVRYGIDVKSVIEMLNPNAPTQDAGFQSEAIPFVTELEQTIALRFA